MSGWLAIAGLGPGAAELVTPEVTATLAQATDLIGYAPYVARVPERAGLIRHGSDNREELDRASLALRLAAEGKRVVVVSSGDPGVFAMAAAVFEAVDGGDPAWRDLDIRVLPGISAMFAAAARIGAPLGHDFCAINLSDNLKPWELIEKRLRLAAQADFVIALYNPLSKARPWQLGRALEFAARGIAGDGPGGVRKRRQRCQGSDRDRHLARRGGRARRHAHAGADRLVTNKTDRARQWPPVCLYAALCRSRFVTKPAQHLGDALDLFPRGNEGPAHHDRPAGRVRARRRSWPTPPSPPASRVTMMSMR